MVSTQFKPLKARLSVQLELQGEFASLLHFAKTYDNFNDHSKQIRDASGWPQFP